MLSKVIGVSKISALEPLPDSVTEHEVPEQKTMLTPPALPAPPEPPAPPSLPTPGDPGDPGEPAALAEPLNVEKAEQAVSRTSSSVGRRTRGEKWVVRDVVTEDIAEI
jgi:hypothetical protein